MASPRPTVDFVREDTVSGSTSRSIRLTLTTIAAQYSSSIPNVNIPFGDKLARNNPMGVWVEFIESGSLVEAQFLELRNIMMNGNGATTLTWPTGHGGIYESVTIVFTDYLNGTHSSNTTAEETSVLKSGTNTMSLSATVSSGNYSGTYSGTFSFNVGNPVLAGITLGSNTLPDQRVGRTLKVADDFKVYATWESPDPTLSVTCVTEVTGWTTNKGSSVWTVLEKGTQTVTITFTYTPGNGATVSSMSANATCKVYGLDHIEAEDALTSFYSGQYFSRGNIKIKAVYGDGNEEYVTARCAFAGEPEGPLTVGSGSYTVTYTDENGDTASLTINYVVTETEILSIELSGSYQTDFDYGSDFDSSGLVVTAHYNDSTQDRELDSSEYTVSLADGTTLLQLTSKTITVSHGGKNATYVIRIKYLHSIEAEGYKDEFWEGENFSYGQDISVVANYLYSDGSDGGSEEITTFTSNYSTSVIMAEAGTKTVTLSYRENGIEATYPYSVVVKELVVSSLSVDASDLDEDEEGEILFYQNYTTFSPSQKIAVSATMSNGNVINVPLGSCDFQPSVGSVFTTTGTKTVTISFGGKTASYSVTVVAHEIDHIEVSSASAKKTFDVGDKFEYEGIVVKAVYVSGYEEEITDGANGYSISPQKNYSFVENDYGTNTVTVTYSGETATYSISVDYPTLESIVIDASALNLNPKNGDVWNAALLAAKAIYSSGYEKALTYATSIGAGKFVPDVTALNLSNSNEIGVSDFREYDIPILAQSHFGNETKSANVSVSVLPNKQLKTLYVDASQAKTEYKTGEEFTGEGFVLVATFLDTVGQTRIAVSMDNPAIQSVSPSLGATIYKAGAYNVEFSYTYLNVTMTASSRIIVVPSYTNDEAKTKTLKIVKRSYLQYEEVTNFNAAKNQDGQIWALYDVDDTIVLNGVRSLNPNVLNPKCYGYVLQGANDGGYVKEPAKVVLFDDYQPPVDGESNVIVSFPKYVEGEADKINKCRFGCLFGNRNSKNRLFVSGNPDFPNLDWHSEAFNLGQLEENEAEMANYKLTYFPDTSMQQYGLTSNSISGYAILPTGDLFVMKTESRQEPTFYTRSAGTMNAVTGAGSSQQGIDGSSLQMEVYAISTGNADEGGLGHAAMLTFNGEVLTLTKNGLKAISPSTNIAAIKTVSRSSKIDKILKSQQLSTWKMFQDGESLYLLSGKDAYVATKSAVTQDGQYEWFYFDGFPATCAVKASSGMWFGTEDGALCKVNQADDLNFCDLPKSYVGVGGVMAITASEANDTLAFNLKYADAVKEGTIVEILADAYEKEIYTKLGTFASLARVQNYSMDQALLEGYVDKENGFIVVRAFGDPFVMEDGTEIEWNEYIKLLFYQGREVYLDQIESNSPVASTAVGNAYLVEREDPNTGDEYESGVFRLVRSDGTYAELNLLDHVRISEQTPSARATDVKRTSTTLTCKLKADHDREVDIIQYAGQNMASFAATLTNERPIKCRYETKPFFLGSLVYKKNILSWTTVNDTKLRSELDLGYCVSNGHGDYKPVIGFTAGSMTFDASAFSFKRASTLADRLPHVYTRWKTCKSVDCITFMFGNDSDANCVLTNITITYTGGEPREGDR